MKLDNVFKKTRIAVGRKNYITFTTGSTGGITPQM